MQCALGWEATDVQSYRPVLTVLAMFRNISTYQIARWSMSHGLLTLPGAYLIRSRMHDVHELGGKKRQDAAGSGQNTLNHPYAQNDYYMYLTSSFSSNRPIASHASQVPFK